MLRSSPLLGGRRKQIDFSHIKTLCVEDLKRVKHNKKGKFPRVLKHRAVSLAVCLYYRVVEQALGRARSPIGEERSVENFAAAAALVVNGTDEAE